MEEWPAGGGLQLRRGETVAQALTMTPKFREAQTVPIFDDCVYELEMGDARRTRGLGSPEIGADDDRGTLTGGSRDSCHITFSIVAVPSDRILAVKIKGRITVGGTLGLSRILALHKQERGTPSRRRWRSSGERWRNRVCQG
ncbi:hypothetical protein [Oryza sativa Japonica Group]|uniref:Uncharacterized protein n=1 Tax=Oryza sativa subsp. japonica TaxID=39947 RepID=Q5JLC0_ORYSJ|nr:hypothetical protein [Oryza sativa Japonica Group]